MKTIITAFALALATGTGSMNASAFEIQMDLAPPGTEPGVGLSGLNEAPPNQSTAAGGELGSGIIYDTEGNLLTFAVGYGTIVGFNDLEGNFTGAHLHLAPPGEPGPVAIDLASLHVPLGASAGLLSGTLRLTEEQESSLVAGNYYLNVHSTVFPDGEIRGQLVLIPEPGTFVLLAMGAGVLGIRGWRRRGA